MLKTVVWMYLFVGFGFFWTTKCVETKQKINTMNVEGTWNITVKDKWAEAGKHTVIWQLSPGQESSLSELSTSENHLINSHTTPTDTERGQPHSEHACNQCELSFLYFTVYWYLLLVTSRNVIGAGSSSSRYVCVLAQRSARIRALLLLLSAYSNFSCSEPGGDAAW